MLVSVCVCRISFFLFLLMSVYNLFFFSLFLFGSLFIVSLLHTLKKNNRTERCILDTEKQKQILISLPMVVIQAMYREEIQECPR